MATTTEQEDTDPDPTSLSARVPRPDARGLRARTAQMHRIKVISRGGVAPQEKLARGSRLPHPEQGSPWPRSS